MLMAGVCRGVRSHRMRDSDGLDVLMYFIMLVSILVGRFSRAWLKSRSKRHPLICNSNSSKRSRRYLRLIVNQIRAGCMSSIFLQRIPKLIILEITLRCSAVRFFDILGPALQSIMGKTARHVSAINQIRT